MSALKKYRVFPSFFIIALITLSFVPGRLMATSQAKPPAAPQPGAAAAKGPAPAPSTTTAAPLPKDYVIGVDDVLSVVFWSAKELSAEALVRPDGKISLPLLNDVMAAGMTPEQLATAIGTTAKKFVQDPGATVIVRAINSRKIYVVGQVGKPGSLPLMSDMNVLQVIAEAGGFLEDAKKGEVVVVRVENGQERRYKVNYNDIVRGKNLQQNIRLQPGDTVIVR